VRHRDFRAEPLVPAQIISVSAPTRHHVPRGTFPTLRRGGNDPGWPTTSLHSHHEGRMCREPSQRWAKEDGSQSLSPQHANTRGKGNRMAYEVAIQIEPLTISASCAVDNAFEVKRSRWAHGPANTGTTMNQLATTRTTQRRQVRLLTSAAINARAPHITH